MDEHDEQYHYVPFNTSMKDGGIRHRPLDANFALCRQLRIWITYKTFNRLDEFHDSGLPWHDLVTHMEITIREDFFAL